LKAAAAVRRRIAPEPFHVGGGDREVAIVQLVLEFAQQTLKPTTPSNWLPQRPRFRGSEINGHVFPHAEHDTDECDRGGHASIAAFWLATKLRQNRIECRATADDVASGRWAARNADLLAQDALDVGYRLLVVRL
jgi:hypothetical protein